MPRYSAVTFAVQPVEMEGKVSGYVVSGFLNEKQLQTLRGFVDSDEYEKSSRWRGQYLEMARAIVTAIDRALPAAGSVGEGAPLQVRPHRHPPHTSSEAMSEVIAQHGEPQTQGAG